MKVGSCFLPVNQASARPACSWNLGVVGGGRHASLRYFCSPLHQETALHPIIAHWEQEAGFARGDTSEQRLSKLESLLAPDEFSPAEVALLAGMLGIPPGERYAQPDLSPRRRREQTFAVLQRRLARIARRQPVLMLVEDVTGPTLARSNGSICWLVKSPNTLFCW